MPKDEKNEWLQDVDIFVALALIGLIDDSKNVLEIGVWKGSWVLSILMNTSKTKVVGVDPYPNRNKIRESMLDRIKSFGVDNRFKLVSSIDELQDLHQTFGLVHVDGEHSEKQTHFDLVESSRRLTKKGVIIVDDVNVAWFPGVSSAMHMFMIEQEFRMFMGTKGKAYLARKEFANEFYSKLINSKFLSDKADIFQSYQNASYEQSTSVLGQEVLICRPMSTPRLKSN